MSTRTRLLVLALLSSCDSCLPKSWRATPKAGFERMAAARLTICVQTNPCTELSRCFAESEAYCLDAGYAKSCGNGEPEGSCGVAVR